MDQANALLDGTSYSEKDADGFRVWPGTDEAITFTSEGTAEPGSPDEDAVQQIVGYYEDVGIRYVAGMPLDNTTGDEHLLHTETYFWEDPENHTQ